MISLAAATATLALGAASAAGESTQYNGASIGFAATAGPLLLNDDRVSSRAGFSAGFAGRLTGPMLLADVELGYQVSKLGSVSAGNVPFDLIRQGFTTTVGLHPLFLALLGNRRIDYIAASFHADIGASLQVTSISAGGERSTRGDVAWHWGGGIDFPLTDPNLGRALWLGLLYRNIRLKTDLRPDISTDLGDHQVLLTLGYRWNWR